MDSWASGTWLPPAPEPPPLAVRDPPEIHHVLLQLTVADLNKLTLTVYVPQNRLGQVYIDQPVRITINSFPDRAFTGHVSRIADRAEFTPRNVATQEERVNLVFAVEIAVTNQDGVLKPGMPADVVIGE